MSAFQELGLMAELVRAVADEGYTTPTPVQSRSIPPILAGRDLMAAAQTGTGKTAGFTLPMLQRLMKAPVTGPRGVRALVLVPTRELAAQVAESVRTYGAHLPLRSLQIYGGVGMQPQINNLRRGVDIVIATPGRLLDLAGQRAIDLSKIEILVLDEADRMLDMGFIHDIRRILALLPNRRQNLMFSATFADEIRGLAESMMDKPEQIDVAPRNSAAELVEQTVYRVDTNKKAEALIHLVQDKGWAQCLVFTRTKHGANRLAQKLENAGVNADAIHGNKSQNARTRALTGFKHGKIRVLVATDIAARGIDIDHLPQVVNFELPNVPEDYVHRIGRTGRAGSSGHAVSLVGTEERPLLRNIERLLKRTLQAQVIPGFEPDPNAKPEPLPTNRRGGGGGGGGGQRRGGGGGGGGNRGRSSNSSGGGNSSAGGNRPPRRNGNRKVA